MAQRDHRYKIIKPMFDKGAIHSFKDIFLFIPKSVVAADLGKRLSRFSFLMNRVEKFTFEEVFLIGKFCDLSVPEILKLVETEYLKNKKSIRSDNTLKSDIPS
jgi:hypothetical protein